MHVDHCSLFAHRATAAPNADPEIADQQRSSLATDAEAQVSVWTELVLVFLHLASDLDDATFTLLLPLLFPGSQKVSNALFLGFPSKKPTLQGDHGRQRLYFVELICEVPQYCSTALLFLPNSIVSSPSKIGQTVEQPKQSQQNLFSDIHNIWNHHFLLCLPLNVKLPFQG